MSTDPIYISVFADPGTVRDMSGYPDTTEVPDDQLQLYCTTADAKVMSDTNIKQLQSTDPRLSLMTAASNKQAAILVRLGWNDKEGRIGILKDLYNSDIASINMSGLGISGGGAGGEGGGMFVVSSSYKTRKLSGDLDNFYLSSY